MKEIKLSQQGKNKGRFIALVDDEDYIYLNQFKWHAAKNGKSYYARRRINIGLNKQMAIMMEHDIMHPLSGKIIDHLDHNGLNNQRYNLRPCTNKENSKNRTPFGKSKYLGVSIAITHVKYIKKDGSEKISYSKPKYQAIIKSDYKSIYLGRFENEQDAALAYDIAAKKYHGKFANLNFK